MANGGDRRRIGYSFWGYMSDLKLGPDGRFASQPDGNYIYSWAIIDGMLARGYDVVRFGIDRDYEMVNRCGMAAFSSFAMPVRYRDYVALDTPEPLKSLDSAHEYAQLTEDMLISIWENMGYDDVEFILHEWRMQTPRNDERARETALNSEIDYGDYTYTPDLVIQRAVIAFCEKHGIPLVLFDLDYALGPLDACAVMQILDGHVGILELGHKWELDGDHPDIMVRSWHTNIPFSGMVLREESTPPNVGVRNYDCVYVGNRYDRDDSMVKFFGGEDAPRLLLCGRWDPEWVHRHLPNAQPTGRIQPYMIRDVYGRSHVTMLLARPEYYRHGFVTARMVEALLGGCIPLVPVRADEPYWRNGYSHAEASALVGPECADTLLIRWGDSVVDHPGYRRLLDPDTAMPIFRALVSRASYLFGNNGFCSQLEELVKRVS